jgi:DNA-binding Lrp family transcriptional regulator
VEPNDDSVMVSGTNQRLLAELGRDGRASHTELAEVTGWSPSTVARRIDPLRTTAALFFDDALLGVTTAALLWMSVPPADLDRVATTLAGHPELAVVAATTGPTNLLATVLCPDAEALHHYLTHRLARTPVTHLETVPRPTHPQGRRPAGYVRRLASAAWRPWSWPQCCPPGARRDRSGPGHLRGRQLRVGGHHRTQRRVLEDVRDAELGRTRRYLISLPS